MSNRREREAGHDELADPGGLVLVHRLDQLFGGPDDDGAGPFAPAQRGRIGLGIAQHQQRNGGATNRCRVAADGLAMLIEYGALRRKHLWLAPDVPFVGMLGHEAKGALFASPADQDWQPLLRRFRIARRVGHREMRTGERRAAFGEHAPDDRERLREPIETPRERVELESVRFVFVFLPAGTQAEDEPTVADLIDGAGDLREHGRVAVGRRCDECPEANPRYTGCEGGEVRERLMRRAIGCFGLVRHEMIGEPKARVAEALCNKPRLQCFGPGHGGRNPEAESHLDTIDAYRFAMSVPVEPDDLAGVIETRIGSPFLISVAADGRPRVSSVEVVVSEGRLVVGVGQRTLAGLADRPDVTLLWPHAETEAYALIVDGEAAVVDARAVVTPTWAVLHVPAARRGS